MVRRDRIGHAALHRRHRQCAQPDDLLRRRAAGVILPEQAAGEVVEKLDLAESLLPVLRYPFAEPIDAATILTLDLE
jgi:hypothetical protein